MNIVLMILDALRYDRVNQETTPNLMRIADEGAFFTNAFACNSSTNLSIPCILSSNKKYDPEDNVAAVVKKNGFYTAMIHSNPIVQAFYPGFEETIDIKSTKLRLKKSWKKIIRKNLPAPVISGLKKLRAKVSDEEKYIPYARADETIDFTLNWMKGHDDYFLWVHLMDPHIPYYPTSTSLDITRKEMIELNDKIVEAAHGNYEPTEEEIEIAKVLYREEIQEMDAALGRFHGSFNTDDLLVITADHGEEFNEYGQFSHQGNKIIPELIHVPLIFYGGGVRGNKVIREYASHLSIAPTILEALGIPRKLGLGKSLWKSLTEQP